MSVRDLTDTELDRALADIGAELDRLTADRRATPTPLPTPRHGRRLVLIGLSTAAAVAAIAGIALRRPPTDPPDFRPADSTRTESAPALPPEADADVAVRLCIDSMAEMAASFGFPGAPPVALEFPDPEQSDVVTFDVPSAPSQVAVLLADGDLGYHCVVPRDANERTRVNGQPFATSEAPTPDDRSVSVDDLTGTGSDLGTGPGSITVVGSAGADVTAVALELEDGAVIDGAVTDGWFYVTGRVRGSVPLFDFDVVWTLSDGTIDRAPRDWVDRLDSWEQCAEDPTCVDERLATAEATIRDSSDLLDDGEITAEQAEQVRLDWAECAQDAGYDVRVLADGSLEAPAIEVDPVTGEPLEDDPNLGLYETCPEDLGNAVHAWTRLTEILARDDNR